MNVYLPEFGLWRPPLLLAGRLWTPAEKEQESHLYIHEEQVMFYLIFICFPQKKTKKQKQSHAICNDMSLTKWFSFLRELIP